jgi:hypothetical protein
MMTHIGIIPKVQTEESLRGICIIDHRLGKSYAIGIPHPLCRFGMTQRGWGFIEMASITPQ